MSIESVPRLESTAVLEIDGTLDVASVHELTAAVDDVDLLSITLLVLDLGDVGFLDLAGVNAILSLNAECKNYGVHLAVIAPRSSARRVFTLTRVDLELDLVDAGGRFAR